MLKCSERLGFDRLREIVNRFESDLPQMDANTADGRLSAFILRLRAAAAQQ